MRDTQYNYMADDYKTRTTLGLVGNSTWDKDPKRLLFSLSRYKTVSKLIAGSQDVIEVGCGDGWNAKLVSEVVERLTLSDYCHEFTNEAAVNSSHWRNKPTILCHNFIERAVNQQFDAAYALDVLEHIPKTVEQQFLVNLRDSCQPYSKFIFGMPSLESQSYILPENRDPGHINCKTQAELVDSLKSVFKVVFPFSMNDEVLHTGFAAMSNYLICICVN